MYYSGMERKVLKELLSNYYSSKHTIDAIVAGKRKPNPDVRFKLYHLHGIPFDIWGDRIKSYLNHNASNTETSRINESKNLPKAENA